MFVTFKTISFFSSFYVHILTMRKCTRGAMWNAVIDTVVVNFVVTDDGDNMYVDIYGKYIYGLLNG